MATPIFDPMERNLRSPSMNIISPIPSSGFGYGYGFPHVFSSMGSPLGATDGSGASNPGKRRSSSDQTGPFFAGKIIPGPLKHHHQFVIEFDEIPDVNEQPGHPGREHRQLSLPKASHRPISPDHRQASFVSVAEGARRPATHRLENRTGRIQSPKPSAHNHHVGLRCIFGSQGFPAHYLPPRLRFKNRKRLPAGKNESCRSKKQCLLFAGFPPQRLPSRWEPWKPRMVLPHAPGDRLPPGDQWESHNHSHKRSMAVTVLLQ